MTKIIRKSKQVAEALTKLGLSERIVNEVVLRSEAKRRQFVHLYPRIVKGVVCWGEKFAALREVLGQTWTYDEEGGLPKVISPDGKIAIGVLAGNTSTGFSNQELRSLYRRGIKTVEIVESNAIQLAWSDEQLGIMAPVAKKKAYQLWMLTTYRDIENNLIRVEVGLPDRVGSDEHVEGWRERIILKEISLDDEVKPSTGEEESKDVVPDVRRKV